MEQLYYYLHEESDKIIISKEDGSSQYLYNIGEVKERTLKELKSLLIPEHWVFQLYLDEELIKTLELKEDNTIYIYTDGSCNNRTKLAGGCGIVLIYKGYEKHISIGQYVNTTSARMEIRGVLEALRQITDKTTPIILYCDNIYCVKAISEKWAERWERENWVANTTDGLRMNHDLWKQVLEEIRKFKSTVQFQWLKGHNGDKYNEICDKLAAEGGKKPIIADDEGRISNLIGKTS